MNYFKYQCALGEFKGIPALILQTESLMASGFLLSKDPNTIEPLLGKIDGELLFIVYDSITKNIDSAYAIQKINTDCVEFVKKVKDGETWLLCLQVVIHSDDSDTESKYAFISLRNIGDNIHMGEPQIKSGWVVSL